MIETKAWGYVHPEIGNILRDKAVSNTCITKKRAGYNTMPLFTAEQLAEAVAAQRERVVADIVERIDTFSATGNVKVMMNDQYCSRIVEAVQRSNRSTTK